MTGDRRPRTTKPIAAIVLLLLVCAATSTAKYSGVIDWRDLKLLTDYWLEGL